MKELRFETPATKKVHIFGEDFICREPSVFEQFKYEKELQTKEGEEIFSFVLDYIASLGIPKESAMKLSSANILKLIAFIAEPEDKKK